MSQIKPTESQGTLAEQVIARVFFWRYVLQLILLFALLFSLFLFRLLFKRGIGFLPYRLDPELSAVHKVARSIGILEGLDLSRLAIAM